MKLAKNMPNGGLLIHPFLQVFDETFAKSGRTIFRQFFRDIPHVSKWMVLTDYAYYDKNKFADVVTYSFVPYFPDFQDASDYIASVSFKDIKSLKRVNPEFLALINRLPILNVSIAFDRKRRFGFVKEAHDLLETFGMLEKMVKYWGVTTPQGRPYYKKYLADIAIIMKELRGNRPNLKLIRDIYFIASMTAYLMFEVAQSIDLNRIGWFSDRDALLSYKQDKLSSPLIFNLISSFYHSFCERNGIDKNGNPALGVPNQTGAVWYDALLRIPDLICGTLAAQDPISQNFSHEKFTFVDEMLLASNEKQLFFKLSVEPEHFSYSAVRVTKTRGADPNVQASKAVQP